MAGIYIHIPFCKSACNYCNFHFATSLNKKDQLMAAINQELMIRFTEERMNLDTIYFGGGTPSILPVEDVATVLNTIAKHYTINAGAEITLEANPDDINVEKLQQWKFIGVNRLSIGIQSFFEEDLKWMSRAHNSAQAQEALQLALTYFDNITIDLIYGTPGLSHFRWQQNVEKAISFKVPHLSCYALTVEPKTPLNKLIRMHQKSDVDPEIQSEQFLMLMQWAREAGYEHYEISNFALPGFRSRHNSSYWKGKSYIGIGPSAHSYDGQSRQWNIANNQHYIDAIQKGQLPCESETLTEVQRLNESIMISLRTMEGIDLSQFSKQKVQTVLNGAEKYINQQKLLVSDGFLKLSDQGKLYADGIAADLFFDE
ncbi:MAG TPA: radical SAM family heme chaperone HemW [Niabella sp.]|nr:radical SAM family heme chaperone HemW [Niabella sp.]HOZ96859.1 radical SAM family heme chaperone HemW [Niabella sp.]HQW15067.1 radical SAM family heme chaperone HemW [Niabella sp.]HQX20208.1 radical SAM family heme chaperone HemW [Niabella sp.]HQX42090.1 radical SAM family heme chaperone HemW [Niabella sp.]